MKTSILKFNSNLMKLNYSFGEIERNLKMKRFFVIFRSW
jgi:hypothetical protein